MSESKASVNRVTAADRQRRAIELRSAGKTFAAIAEQLGYGGPSSAYKAVLSALKKTLQEPADRLRTLELERLDRLQEGLWHAAIGGDPKAVSSVLGIMDRRAKLLGLDAPDRVDITHRIRERALAEGLDPDAAVAAAQHILKERARR